jgi:RND family efflux transporter MFP subunit
MGHVIKKIPAVLVIAALSLFLAGCSGKGASETGEGSRKIPVKAARVSRGTITSYLQVSGTTQAFQQAKVGSKVEGVIKELRADEGTAVKKNDVLLRLEPRDFTLGIDQARATLQQAEHDLEQQSLDWKRISALYNRRVVAKSRYDSMQAAYFISRARVEECRAALGLAKQKYEDSVVRAPFDGVITKKMMHEGEVSSLWAYKWEVFEVMDLSSIKLECDVSEKLKAHLREGMDAEIKIDAYPGETFKGRITTVNPLVEPGQRTFRIKIVIPNPDRKLTAGMFARVRIALDRKENVLVIPGNEILERPDGYFIFVVKDGAVEQRQITPGAREENLAEIKEGLKEGELVVTEGSHRLQNGYKVDIKS